MATAKLKLFRWIALTPVGSACGSVLPDPIAWVPAEVRSNPTAGTTMPAANQSNVDTNQAVQAAIYGVFSFCKRASGTRCHVTLAQDRAIAAKNGLGCPSDGAGKNKRAADEVASLISPSRLSGEFTQSHGLRFNLGVLTCKGFTRRADKRGLVPLHRDARTNSASGQPSSI
jgi:hypothetical protein